MKSTVALTALVLSLLTALGCHHDACDDAASHLEECSPGTPTASGSSSVECSGAVECQALCTSAASCDTITGKATEGLAAYAKCLADCTMTSAK